MPVFVAIHATKFAVRILPKMKFLIVLCAVVACVAARVAKVDISTFQDSLKASRSLGRIVNGSPATANQIPHQASVLAPVTGGFNVCGGSVISNLWILTAAHCTQNTQYNVRVGTLQLQAGGTVLTSFNAINHPSYNPVNLNNDVSVIQLPSALAFSAAIQSIRLPTATQVGTSFVDVQSVVSGFGATGPNTGVSTTLNWVNMRPIPNAECASVYGTAVVVAHVVCGLGYFNPANQGHCGGDSGGPLTIVEGGILTQIGVVSFGAAAGCHLGFPSGYMRTANFVAWIATNTGIAVRP